MKRLTFALTGVCLLALAGGAFAQGGPGGPMMGGYPQMMPAGGYGGGGMGYPGATPANYPMTQQVNAMQAMYGEGDSSGAEGAAMPGPGGPGGPDDGSCPPGGGECGDGGPHGPIGYAYGDFELFYARRTNGYKTQPLVIDTDPITAAVTVITTTHDLEFPYEPGVKATVGYMWAQGFGVEGTYFGQFDLHTGLLHTSTGPTLSLPGDIGNNTTDFDAVPQITASYRSQIQNGELNFVLPYGSFQWLWGFRYMQVQELLDLNGNTGAEASDYVIHTNNNLYCSQLGARCQWEIGRFQFEASVKAGLGDNSANEQQMIRDVGNTVLVTNGTDTRTDIDASKNSVAFIGEVDVSAMIPMGSHWTGRLGYTGVWVTDLALAPNQLDFGIPATNGNFVNTKGNIILHGFTAGVECRF